MATEVSGEALRLLTILSVRPCGATQYELTVQGVNARLIYRAVMLDLVQARPRHNGEVATSYRFYLLDAGRALLSPDGRGPPRGD
jgi:hypothetical protein